HWNPLLHFRSLGRNSRNIIKFFSLPTEGARGSSSFDITAVVKILMMGPKKDLKLLINDQIPNCFRSFFGPIISRLKNLEIKTFSPGILNSENE
ncbi:hypothetical protein L9F63_016250, partial [Diploptera punctata]